jgi:flagella basal body P-ring formation protein FlgA
MRSLPSAVAALVALLLASAANFSAAQQPGVPVAARDLPRGVALSEADVAAPPSGAAGAGSPGESVVGWVTRRVVRVGEPLRPPAIARPQLVQAGEEVTVRLQGAGVLLTLRGTAAAGAGMGDRVWVRLGTGWRVEGTVAGPGEITITAPGRAR